MSAKLAGAGALASARLNGRGATRSLEPETAALVARMSTEPSAARKARINEVVRALKGAGLWTRLAVLHVHAAHDGQAATLNWRDATCTAVPVGGPTFTVDLGFQGDGFSQYLAFSPGYGSIVSASSYTDLLWSLTDIGTGYDAGANTGTTMRYSVRNAANNFNLRANNANTINFATAAGQGIGLLGISREGNATYVTRNGVVLRTDANNPATTFGGSNTINTGRQENSYSNRAIAMRLIASPCFTPAEQVTLHAILLSYMQAVGAA